MNYQKQGYQTAGSPPGERKPKVRKPKRKKSKRSGLSVFWKVFRVFLLLAAVGGIIFGVNLYNAYRETKRYDGIFPDSISIDGISLGGMTLQEGYDALVARAMDRQNSWTLNLTYSGHLYYTLNNDSLGIRTSLQEIYDVVMDAYSIGHTGNPFQRRDELKALEAKPYEVYTTQSSMSTEYLDQILNAIASDMYMEPQDAYLAAFNPDAPDPFTIVSEQPGRSLDIAEAKTKILAMAANGESGSLELEPTPLYASVTTADVRSGVALISTGTTPISTSSTENRNNNIRVAFSRFNGMVVPSGGRVSFNDTVGERTKANGFYEADEYVYGDLVVGIGGGVCQASSTIYKAVLTANLKVNKREPHSELVSYTTFGQDATVDWGGRKIDFVFTNSS
ncbi:MAG: VanW family protein, partial [Clostridia bacterium]|nr:VanW family protein [Clostridia bacterium]